MAEERFGIILTARMRHGALWRAATSLGGVAPLALQLGCSKGAVYRWVNLREAPSLAWLETERGKQAAERLWTLTEQTISELWPLPLRAAIKGGEVGRQIERNYDVSMAQLAYQTEQRLLLPSPEDEAARHEANDLLRGLVDKLPRNQSLVIRLRFGLDGDKPFTLAEIAEVLDVSKERVRKLEAKALHRLRQYGCNFDPGAAEVLGISLP